MRQEETFRKNIRKYFHKYRNILQLNPSWKIHTLIDETILDYAEVEYDFEKKDFIIKINPQLNKNKIDLKDSIVHEMFHILISPITNQISIFLTKIKYKKSRKFLEKLEEQLVKKLTKIIINVSN